MDERTPAACVRCGRRRLAALRAGCAIAWLAALVPLRDAAARDDDPFVRVAAPAGTTGPLVLLLSGDGDWAAFVRGLAEAAAARGAPVLGLKSRTWLAEPRTPEQSAELLETAVRAQLAALNRHDLVIVGYSRGADLAPFAVNRWPEELRARVRAIVLVGLSEHASFEFHLEDLVRDVERPSDLPTRPEVERLAGIPLTCVRGTDEEGSFCAFPVPGMHVLQHQGGHRAGGDVAAMVLRELGLAP
jgi:type IV secretory pathway VirJ component